MKFLLLLIIALFTLPGMSQSRDDVYGTMKYQTDQGIVRIEHDSVLLDFEDGVGFEIMGWNFSLQPQTGKSTESYKSEEGVAFIIVRMDSVIVSSFIKFHPYQLESFNTTLIE